MVTSWEALVARILEIVCLSIFAGCVFAYFKKWPTRPISFSEILVFLNRVYINGLFKLVDRLEEDYVRQRYSRAEFREVQTMRIAQAREYFRKMVANAVMLQNFAYRHQKSEDHTTRWLAHRLNNYAIPVKIFGWGGMLVLFLFRRFLFLDGFYIYFRLSFFSYVSREAFEAYVDLKEAALMLARHSEPGIEVKVAARL